MGRRSVLEVLEEPGLKVVVVNGAVRPQERSDLRLAHEATVSKLDALELPQPGPPADGIRGKLHVRRREKVGRLR